MTTDTRALAVFNVLKRRYMTLGGTGVSVAVTPAAGSIAISLPRAEPDAVYGITALPSWGTTIWVSAQSTTGFTLNFGTVAPGGAFVHWTTFRSEH